MEEKKYEITLSELRNYIGLAIEDVIPKNATLEDEAKYIDCAARIAARVSEHLNGSNPFNEEDLLVADSMYSFVNGFEDLFGMILGGV